MNQYNAQQNAFVSREEMMGLDRSNDLVVCPKPRRVGVLANNLTRPLRLHMRYTKKKKHLPLSQILLCLGPNIYPQTLFLLCICSQAAADLCDSEAGAELLDIIRRKVCFGVSDFRLRIFL